MDPVKRRAQDQQTVWLQQILNQLQQREWHGAITLKLEAGMMVHMKKEESLSPPKGGL